ncbi:MAG: hypothetical protein WA849_09220 [Candidatus Udaeobacter sp.]
MNAIVGFVLPSVFRVNGIPADSGGSGGTIIAFHFNASPVTAGQNTMDIPAGAFTCTGSGRPFEGFHCTFTYQPSTPTPTATPTQPPPSPTATVTSTPTARPTPVPRLRPTPAPRP